jgi:hypothetical protein
MDTVVDRPRIDVLRVRADMKGKGPKAAFDTLESKLPTLKGRRFFGTFRMLDDGEEYYACVEKLPTEDPAALGLEAGTIPGGRYVRRRVWDWESVVAAGKMKEISQEFARGYVLDPDRPSIEFYRSMKELHILLPLAATTAPPSA